tara:strand:+ start:200 stop:385 length:186 start_codon:yes stop_codon:yes gene_type:complete
MVGYLKREQVFFHDAQNMISCLLHGTLFVHEEGFIYCTVHVVVDYLYLAATKIILFVIVYS